MSTEEYKIAICGGGAVGKSSITVQYTQNQFLDEYDPTIQDNYTKQVKIGNQVCVLDILDTAGQEEYQALRDTYMRNCVGFILVYDLTKRKTLFEVKDFIDSILRVKDCDTAPIVLAGNKCDLESEREVTQKDLQTFLENYWKIPCIETSAKQRKNIDECFELIVKELRKSPGPKPDQTSSGKKGGCMLL